jgi:hypothetical protein
VNVFYHPGKEHIMNLQLISISAAIVAYALLASAWICQADLLPLF